MKILYALVLSSAAAFTSGAWVTIHNHVSRSLSEMTDMCRTLDAQDGYTCRCGENTRIDSLFDGTIGLVQAPIFSCATEVICNDETCANFILEGNHGDEGQLEELEICASYTINPHGFKSGCIVVSYDQLKATGCKASFDTQGLGFQTECNSCEVCQQGRLDGFSLDCDNIEPEASTEKCETVADRDFPGFETYEYSGTSAMATLVGTVVGVAMGLVY